MQESEKIIISFVISDGEEVILIIFSCMKMLSMNEPLKMEKRTRGTNFSYEEKSMLLYLVAKHFDVIENKRTDSTTSRYKDQAWEKVTEEFNADIEHGAERSLKQLRICYENIKRKMKRENISPFVYYSKDKSNILKKQIPILPKIEEPENMLVMVHPEMVPPDPYDSSDMTTASCDGAFTPDQNSTECTPYSSTPIISIQRTSNAGRNVTPQSQETSIRIVSVDSCAPSSSIPPRPQQREAEPSKAVSTPAPIHPRLTGITLPSGDVTVAPVIPKDRSRPVRDTPAPSSSQPDTSETDPECVRLKRKLLRRELRRAKLARRMDMEHHMRQMQLLETDLRYKMEHAELKRQVLEAKRNYYLSYKSGQMSSPAEEEQVEGGACSGEEGEHEPQESEDGHESPDNPQQISSEEDEVREEESSQ
ncbi:hypothetical protein B566_EDAN003707 [Ephemera danica]|nr:hypothetical protein B566_EDAN003707 [Ephemera danica]